MRYAASCLLVVTFANRLKEIALSGQSSAFPGIPGGKEPEELFLLGTAFSHIY
jgi:hypothetical protein